MWAPLITPFCFSTWAFSQLLRLPAGKGKLPKYSFSDAKLPASAAGWRFWCLVSEKNTCVGIPKGINRGAHVKQEVKYKRNFTSLELISYSGLQILHKQDDVEYNISLVFVFVSGIDFMTDCI